ncbi:unnamed protein product [Closterium sp. Yama58-4]|nr:unnamed protein product [Closterium sp. Yama58-4]
MGGPLVTSMWRDPARERSRHAHCRSAGPAGLQIQPNADAEGIARNDPCPTDAQATPSPASPVIAAESVARGIALGVSAGLPDHEEMDGVENEDAQGTADRPPCADEVRVAQEKAGEERAAEEPDAEASARAPAAAVRLGGSTQHVQGPTNTPARRGRGQAGAGSGSALSAEPSSSGSRRADGSITPDRTAADASAPK